MREKALKMFGFIKHTSHTTLKRNYAMRKTKDFRSYGICTYSPISRCRCNSSMAYFLVLLRLLTLTKGYPIQYYVITATKMIREAFQCAKQVGCVLSVREGIGFLPGILFTQFSCTKPGPALAPLVFSSRSDNGPAMDQTSLPSSLPVSRR